MGPICLSKKRHRYYTTAKHQVSSHHYYSEGWQRRHLEPSYNHAPISHRKQTICTPGRVDSATPRRTPKRMGLWPLSNQLTYYEFLLCNLFHLILFFLYFMSTNGNLQFFLSVYATPMSSYKQSEWKQRKALDKRVDAKRSFLWMKDTSLTLPVCPLFGGFTVYSARHELSWEPQSVQEHLESWMRNDNYVYTLLFTMVVQWYIITILQLIMKGGAEWEI